MASICRFRGGDSMWLSAAQASRQLACWGWWQKLTGSDYQGCVLRYTPVHSKQQRALASWTSDETTCIYSRFRNILPSISSLSINISRVFLGSPNLLNATMTPPQRAKIKQEVGWFLPHNSPIANRGTICPEKQLIEAPGVPNR